MNTDGKIKINTALLIDYAHGLLQATVAEKIKQAMQADEFLRIEYLGILQMMEDYPNANVEELIEKFAEEASAKQILPLQEQQTKVKQLYNSSFAKYAIGIAASLIIIFSSYYFFKQRESTQNYSIASIESESINNQLIKMFGNRGRVDSIYQLLNDGRYEEFLTRAKPRFNKNINDDKLHYAFIHTLLYLGKNKEASEAFTALPLEITSKNEFKYLEAFIEINEGKTGRESAIAIFQQMEKVLGADHPLNSNTKTILQKLNQ